MVKIKNTSNVTVSLKDYLTGETILIKPFSDAEVETRFLISGVTNFINIMSPMPAEATPEVSEHPIAPVVKAKLVGTPANIEEVIPPEVQDENYGILDEPFEEDEDILQEDLPEPEPEEELDFEPENEDSIIS